MNKEKTDKTRKNNGGEPTTTAPNPTVPNRARTEMSVGAPKIQEEKRKTPPSPENT